MADKKSMAEIWKQMEKQHGGEGLFVGNLEPTGDEDVINTGSYALDDALGIGGFYRGGIIHLAGAKSSGKTLLALSAIAQWQKKDPNNWAMFVDAEFSFDPVWARSLGCDTDRIMVYKENRGVQVFERLVGQPDKKTPGKKTKQGILDLELESGGTGLGIIVIDSIAAIQPPMEETSEIGKANMALLARFLPPELRRITPLLASTKVSLIVINQIRDTMAMYGDPTSSPGGNALAHSNTVMVNFAKINGEESKIKRNDEQVGHHVKARIEKNKKAAPFKVAEFAIEYVKGIVNTNEELRVLGAKYGVIQRPNNVTYVYDGQTYRGKEAMSAALVDPQVQEKLWAEIREARRNGQETTSETTQEESQE